MRNQWSWRTTSRLKAVDTAVKVSKVIGKKNAQGQAFFPSFTDITVVIMSEDRRLYETCKATADGLGNLVFIKRGLADDGTDIEVDKFKKARGPGSYMFATIGSEDIESKADIDDIPTKTSDLENDSGFIDENYHDTTKQDTLESQTAYTSKGSATKVAQITTNNLGQVTEIEEVDIEQPEVNDGTLTIKQNGSTLDTFSANSDSNIEVDIEVPTKTSDITNDSGFITNTVNNLVNYYTKTETYTKTEVNDLVSSFGSFVVVSTLPATGDTKVIYLLGPIGTGADRYEEWIYTTQRVKIGETSVDLTNYFNTSTQTSDAITQGSTNLFLTSAERTKLSNTSGTNTGDQTASDFDIKDLADSTGKRDSWDGKLEAGDNVSDLENDAGYITIAVNNLTNYTKTSDLGDLATMDSIDYTSNKLTNKPTIPTVPTNISAFTNDSGYITPSYHDNTKSDTTHNHNLNDLTEKSYNSLTDKPTIPTVNNGTLTIQKNGVSVGTFTANSSTNESINITVPTNNTELTNGAGYITNSYHDNTKEDILNKATNLSNPDNTHYPTTKAVADAISSAGVGDMLKSTYDPNNVGADAFDYNNFTNTPTIPTKTSDLTNDSGFIDNTYHDSSKQDTISDLNTIRSGASAGATAMQPVNGTAGQVLTKTQNGYQRADASSSGGSVMSETDYQDIPSPKQEFLYFTFDN